MVIWKTIKNESQYEVSSDGQVRNIRTGHVKSLRLDRYGYSRVTLYPSGKTYTVHRLVSETFLENSEDLPQINHKNGNKTDNNVENLEWCNASHNAKHRDTELRSKWKGQQNPEAVLTFAQAKEIKYGDFPNMTNKQIGKLYGVKDEAVRQIRNGTNWKHI
jgi:hypothetical protein